MARDGMLVFSYHNKRNAKRMLRHFAAHGDANPFSLEPTEPMPTLISRHPRVVDALVQNAGFSAPEYQGAAIVHALADIAEKFGRREPAGSGWAPFMGRFRLAPWLIGRSFAQGGEPIAAHGWIDDLFQCPLCGGDLARSDGGFACSACLREYPVDDGIYDFRPQ
jgi:hypothetical protein